MPRPRASAGEAIRAPTNGLEGVAEGGAAEARAAQLRAGVVSGKRLHEKTKKKYSDSVMKFLGWLRDKFPDSPAYDRELHDVVLEYLSVELLQVYLEYRTQKINADGTPGDFYAYEYVSSAKSAIVDLYKQRKVAMPTEMIIMLEEYFGGLKRLHADHKQNGERSMTEGKAALKFDGYKFLANAAVTANDGHPKVHLFAWVFLLFAWNLMARSMSVSSIMFDHIGWVGDCMTVVFPKHKGDPEGNNASPKHVYANPLTQVCKFPNYKSILNSR